MRSSRTGSRLGLFMTLLAGFGGLECVQSAGTERFRICECRSDVACSAKTSVDSALGKLGWPPFQKRHSIMAADDGFRPVVAGNSKASTPRDGPPARRRGAATG